MTQTVEQSIYGGNDNDQVKPSRENKKGKSSSSSIE